jgi:O-succinylbenzoic acid--CoA ligase
MQADFWHSETSHGLSNGAPLSNAPPGHLLVQTSGTEGVAKWCALSKRAFLANAEAVNAHLSASASDRWLIALPTSHVGGFAIYARAFTSGASVSHYEGKWDAARFTAQCRDEAITLTSLVPTQVFDLVQKELRAPSSLRAIVAGGGSLAKELGQRARDLGWPVLQSFGMTETASQIATEPLDHLASGFDPEALEVLPHWDLSTDADGVLSVRGPALASGYVISSVAGLCEPGGGELSEDDAGAVRRSKRTSPGSQSPATTPRGTRWQWHPIGEALRTRDQVQLWQDGDRRFLRFLGRDSQTLKILGELVALPPLQARLDALALGRAERCVLVPVDDARRGTKLVLVSTDQRAATLVDAFNAIERFVRVESLPLTDLGKVRLAELTQRIA